MQQNKNRNLAYSIQYLRILLHRYACIAHFFCFLFRHSQTQDQNPIRTFSSLSFSLIRLQPKTLCNETKHKRKLSHSLMQTSMDLLFSSLLFSGDYSGLLSSFVLVLPLVTIAACARTDRRKEEKEKQHRFSVSCCGQGRSLPILVLVGRGEERELRD